ncbi:MAG: TRAP transporter permease [Clostridia bacterium]|nr:TRAP transporter permease [Clostridia bacterium]MCR5072582.1 TRAP transporter permease [Clostridiales bacterium]
MSDMNRQNTDTGAAQDVKDIMRKYDRESNTRIWEGTPAVIIRFIIVAFSLYCIWSTLFSTAALEKRLTVFLAMIVIMGYLTYPASKKHVRTNYIPWYDIALMVIGTACFLYYCFAYDSLVMVLSSASKMTPFFITVGVIGILCLIELCRRCVGIPILCVAGVLLIYTFTQKKLAQVIYTLFYSTSGVLATPVQVCAKYIFIFIIFGAFLERTGIAAFFIDMANALVGRFAGGPAKVAVVSSALCGMVSGSSVGNTVTTGSVTIPMMKKTGYRPEFAGAVEAAASTGGQIMPPIMGAAAFLMAEYMGITYGEVALKAILPAVLYFAGIFIAVHLEAKKLDLKGIPRENLPKIGRLLRKLYLLLPLVVLVWLVTTNTRTMQFSASVAILVAIVVSLFNREDKITVGKILEALEAGGKGVITVAVACAMAGIISGCITATGLASKLITAVVSISNSVGLVDPTLIALFLTMICCIILGMGVPTTANYCIMASTCAPILITIGVPKIAAHFFVFYFGIVADITPPVALAAYAGSAIAKSNPMKTGVNATKLAIGAFIVPYIFCLNPQMLFIDAVPAKVVLIIVTSLIGIFGVAAALNGFLFRPIPWPLRIIIAAAGLLMMDPNTITDIIGIVLFAIVFVCQYLAGRKREKTV